MTVTISSKHDISKTDDNDNDTCCRDKDCDHTGSLLKDLGGPGVGDKEAEGEKEIKTNKGIVYYEERRRLFTFKEAPDYITHNSYILSGYRGILNTQLCLESIFWWTNETINIWSHIFGFVLFLAVTVRDVVALDVHTNFVDKFVVAFVLICFMVCMALSSLYHTFSCRSARDCDLFLTYDLFGIALALLAIYVSGIYYAFWCDRGRLYFYLFTVIIIFTIAMMLHAPCFDVNSNVKLLVFVGWAAYGVVPTVHWAICMGWFESPLVTLLLPRVVMMYVISATAFVIYLTKVPERFFSGKFDYFGHSHQWWHLLIVCALYYWHSSGMVYLDYRLNHVCMPPQFSVLV